VQPLVALGHWSETFEVLRRSPILQGQVQLEQPAQGEPNRMALQQVPNLLPEAEHFPRSSCHLKLPWQPHSQVLVPGPGEA